MWASWGLHEISFADYRLFLSKWFSAREFIENDRLTCFHRQLSEQNSGISLISLVEEDL
jgi:hypothetical protein